MPAAAALLVDLVNTREMAWSPESLDSPEGAAPLLTALGGQDAGRVRAVRDDLVSVLTAGPAAQPRAWERFTAGTGDVTVRHLFAGPDDVRLEAAGGDPAVAAVVLAVAELVRSGTWSRLKLCAFEPCSAAFYDTTRSRTQRWHSYETCGNRANVAAHRARLRDDAAR